MHPGKLGMNKSYRNLKNFWKNKKVFITGHTGFKGTWLSILLNLLGSKIYGYSLKPERLSLFNQTNCFKIYSKNFYNNINDFQNLKSKLLISKPQIIFHLAAQSLVSDSFKNPLETFNTNIMGTLNVLEAARSVKSVKSLLIITTDKVYKIKSKNKSYAETDELGGIDPYSASKACAEISVNSYIESFLKKKKTSFVVGTARAGNVIGGGDYSKNRLVPDILKAFNQNKKLEIRNPTHIRPWQHVIEPLTGYLILAQKQYYNRLSKLGHAWNFGPKTSGFITVKQIINVFKGFKIIKKLTVKKNKNNETKILKLNSSKSIKHLNWNQKWDIHLTIKKIIEWNMLTQKNKNFKKICEKQIADYFK
jgi:CDP-glucose 4,6-dehydratase